jgi:hypothetical protein
LGTKAPRHRVLDIDPFDVESKNYEVNLKVKSFLKAFRELKEERILPPSCAWRQSKYLDSKLTLKRPNQVQQVLPFFDRGSYGHLLDQQFIETTGCQFLLSENMGCYSNH